MMIFLLLKKNRLLAQQNTGLKTFPKGIYIMPISPNPKIIHTKINDSLTVNDDITIRWFKINKEVDAGDIKKNKMKSQTDSTGKEQDILEICYFIFLDDQRVLYYSSHSAPIFKNGFRVTKRMSIKNYKRGYYYIKNKAIEIELETDRGEFLQLTGSISADTMSFDKIFIQPEIKTLYERPNTLILNDILDTELQFYFLPTPDINLELEKNELIDSISFDREKAVRTYYFTNKNNSKGERSEQLDNRDNIFTW